MVVILRIRRGVRGRVAANRDQRCRRRAAGRIGDRALSRTAGLDDRCLTPEPEFLPDRRPDLGAGRRPERPVDAVQDRAADAECLPVVSDRGNRRAAGDDGCQPDVGGRRVTAADGQAPDAVRSRYRTFVVDSVIACDAVPA